MLRGRTKDNKSTKYVAIFLSFEYYVSASETNPFFREFYIILKFYFPKAIWFAQLQKGTGNNNAGFHILWSSPHHRHHFWNAISCCSPNSTRSRDKCGTAHRREIKIAAKWTFSLDMRNTAPNRTTQGQMLFSHSNPWFWGILYFKGMQFLFSVLQGNFGN